MESILETSRTLSRVGVATSPTHHGEIVQGVFHDGEGRLQRALISLPCSLFSVQATFAPASGAAVTVWPPAKVKAARAAEETLRRLGWPRSAGHLQLSGEVPESRGFGSSTADALAAIRAVQDAFLCELPDSTVAEIAVYAETASDPLMFDDRAVLFAQRIGRVLEDFTRPLPPLSVLGFGTSLSGKGVDTLAIPPAQYDQREIAQFAELRHMARTALHNGDARLLGEVATASAAINQRHLPVPAFDTIRGLIERVDAVGLQVAHSGNIAGLLFDAAHSDLNERHELARKMLREMLIDDTWLFEAGGLVA